MAAASRACASKYERTASSSDQSQSQNASTLAVASASEPPCLEMPFARASTASRRACPLVEVAARALPRDHVPNDALGLHAARPIVQVRELDGHLLVEQRQLRLPRGDGRVPFGDAGCASNFASSASVLAMTFFWSGDRNLTSQMPGGSKMPPRLSGSEAYISMKSQAPPDGGVDDDPGAAPQLGLGTGCTRRGDGVTAATACRTSSRRCVHDLRAEL